MRKILIAVAASAALCTASVPAAAFASGQDDAQAQQTTQPRARSADGDERRICVNERVSESRMTRRVCRTAREWRESNDTGQGN